MEVVGRMRTERSSFTMRRTLFLAAALWCGAAHAQLEKLFIDGRFLDAATGEPIIDARMLVTDSLDKQYTFSSGASARGEFSAFLYSGAHYVLRFEAEGYASRCAVIDLKADRDWPDVAYVWRIKMEVPLSRPGEVPAAQAGCDWRCTYHARTNKLEWREPYAQEHFPVVVAKNEGTPEEIEMSHARSDNRYLLVKGSVRDMRDDSPLPGARVTFLPGSGSDSTIVADARGNYEMKMTFDQLFRVRYEAEGKVAKIVEIDPRTVPQKERKQGFVAWTDITLFAPVPDADFSFLEEPIGRAAYDPKTRTIAWDMDYSLPIMERLNAILEGH